MKSFRILALLSSCLLAAGCAGGGSDCDRACENLSDCGKLRSSESDCRRNCKDDPTVLSEDIRCFATSTCDDLDACMVPEELRSNCLTTCDRIYGACSSSLSTSQGELDVDGCMSLCRKDAWDEKRMNCVLRSACNRVGECL